MSISSKLLFPVAYSSSESDTCYSAVFKRLLPLFCSEGQPGQQFLVSEHKLYVRYSVTIYMSIAT